MSTHSDRMKSLEAQEQPCTARVQLGIAFLQTKDARWRNKISIRTLDVGHSKHCLLGQVCGDFYDGLKKFDLSHADAQRLGFLPSYTREIIDTLCLNHAWRKALSNQRPWYMRLFAL